MPFSAKFNLSQIHNRLFGRWVLQKLALKSIVMNGSSVIDLNGYQLIQLAEILSGKTFARIESVPKNPKTEVQKLYAMGTAIEFLRDIGMPVDLLPSPDDLIVYDSSSMIDILWNLFLKFERFDERSAPNAKESLLNQVRSKLSDSKVYGMSQEQKTISENGESELKSNEIENIKTSNVKLPEIPDFLSGCWSDGQLLCALIHCFNPRQMPKFNTLKRGRQQTSFNLRLAFHAMSKILSVEPVMLVEDFDKVDERAIVLFVSEIYNAYQRVPKLKVAVQKVNNMIEFVRERDRLCKQYTKTSIDLKKQIEMSIEYLKNIEPDKLQNEADVFSHQDELKLFSNIKKLEIFDGLSTLRSLSNTYSIEMTRNSRPGLEASLSESTSTSTSSNRKSTPSYDDLYTLYETMERLELDKKQSLLQRFNRLHLLVQEDERHKKLVKKLVKWMIKTRAVLQDTPDLNEIGDITTNLCSHRALSLEIQANRRHFRSELEQIENKLIDSNYNPEKLKRVQERVRLTLMFDSIEKQQLSKHALLKDLEERAQFMIRLKQLDTQHLDLCESVKKMIDTQMFYLQKEEEAVSVEEARTLLTMLKINRQEFEESLKLDYQRMEELQAKISSARYQSQYSKARQEDADSMVKRYTEVKQYGEQAFTYFPKKEECLKNLVLREEFKENVKLMDMQHQKQTKRIIDQCKEYRDLIETLGTNVDNIAKVHSDFAQLDVCNQAIEHEMNHKVSGLRSLEDSILSSVFESHNYPSHRQKHANDEGSMKALSGRYEDVVVAMADLSERCTLKRNELQKILTRELNKEEMRLQFSAMVDEFTQQVEHSTDSVKESHFGFSISDMENYQQECEASDLSMQRDAEKMLADIKSVAKRCEEMKISDGHASNVLIILNELYSKFQSVLAKRREKYHEELAKKKGDDSLCKEFADLLNNFCDKLDSNVKKVCLDGTSIFKSKIEQLEFTTKLVTDSIEFSKLLEKIVEKEKVLLDREITINPHTSFKSDDAQSLLDNYRLFIGRKAAALQRVVELDKLKGCSDSDIEKLFLEFAKHYDANRNPYLDSNSFRLAIESYGDKKTDEEYSEILNEYGQKAKGDSTLVVSQKNFSLYMQKSYGDTRTKEDVFHAFAMLNNGMPFVRKEHLMKYLNEADARYFMSVAPKFREKVKKSHNKGPAYDFESQIDRVYSPKTKKSGSNSVENSVSGNRRLGNDNQIYRQNSSTSSSNSNSTVTTPTTRNSDSILSNKSQPSTKNESLLLRETSMKSFQSDILTDQGVEYFEQYNHNDD